VTPTNVRASLAAGAIEVLLPRPWLHVDLVPSPSIDVITELAHRLGGTPGDWTPAQRAAVADALTVAVAAGAVCLLVRPETGPDWAVPAIGCLRLLPRAVATAEELAQVASSQGEGSSAIGYRDGLPVVATVRRQPHTLEVRYVVLCPAVTVTLELSVSLRVDARRIVDEAARVISLILVN
jgi:hypothetical protein